MNLILQSMRLIDFKGVRDLSVDFDPHTQNIYGHNGVGKTTLFNGFLWCLFGKDIEGRANYQVKTTDENGQEIHHLENTVELALLADGNPVKLKRVLIEKWQKPHSQVQEVFKGNETEYYWNDVPMREKDFVIKVNMIIPEDVFKLLTNPLYFNTGLTAPKIPDWQARRAVLMEMAGPISDRDLAAGNERFETLLKALSGKNIREWRLEQAAKKKKLNEQLDQIKPRINEVLRSIPEAIDFEALERQIMVKEREIAEVDAAMQSIVESQKGRNKEQLQRQNAIFGHQQTLQHIEAEIRADFLIAKSTRENEIKTLKSNVRALDTELSNLQSDKRRLEVHKAALEQRMTDLRNDWNKVDGNLPRPAPGASDFDCPHCGRQLPEDKRSEKQLIYENYLATFNSNKVKRKNEITEEGVMLRQQADKQAETITADALAIEQKTKNRDGILQSLIGKENESVELNATGESAIKAKFAEDAKAIELRTAIADIEQLMEASKNELPDNSELKTKRQFLQSDLDALKQQRTIKEQITRGNERIEELKKDETKYGQELAGIERMEDIALDFGKAKVAIVEERINAKFKIAHFKMFYTQVDGTEVECCETMVDGVVFGSLNTGGKLQVGIDIINALSKHYGVTAPIFLDNRESVFVIPDTDSQIINLIAMEDVDHLVFDRKEAMDIAASKLARKKLQIA